MTKYPYVHERHIAVENARREMVQCLQELRKKYHLTEAEEELLLANELAALLSTGVRIERSTGRGCCP